MGPSTRFNLAAATVAAILATGAAAQSTTDPGTPRNPNNSGNNAYIPTLMDMGSGTGQGNLGPFVTVTDKEFARLTAVRALMEIELGKKAMEKGDSEAVKGLGSRMADDYTQWSTGIRRASARLGIALPNELDAKHKAEVDRIEALEGPEFDRAFLKEMVRLQNKALTITQYEAANAGVTGFRHWSGVTLPAMQDQLKQAKQILGGPTVVSKK